MQALPQHRYEADLTHKATGRVVRVHFTGQDDIHPVSGFGDAFPFDVNWSDIKRALFEDDRTAFVCKGVELWRR